MFEAVAMIRRVAFKKAGLAGASGALAWELAVRVLLFFGIPACDLVRVLGTLAVGPDRGFLASWTAGIVIHLIVGVIWAIFYAYFFWSAFDIPPFLQGIVFSLFPALLAGLIMIPQMDLMLDGQLPKFGVFAAGIGWGGPVAIIAGHLVYGAVMGSIYTHPVGYPVGKRITNYG